MVFTKSLSTEWHVECNHEESCVFLLIAQKSKAVRQGCNIVAWTRPRRFTFLKERPPLHPPEGGENASFLTGETTKFLLQQIETSGDAHDCVDHNDQQLFRE